MAMDLKDVKDVVKERMGNPFFGSLVLAFIASNGKAILVLFYAEEEWSFDERLAYISKHIYGSTAMVALYVYVIPILVAVFAVTALPWIVTYLDRISHAAIVERKRKRQEQEATLPENIKLLGSLQSQNSSLDQQNITLREEVQKLKGEENEKGRRWAKTLQAIVNSDEYYKQTLKSLFGKFPQHMEQTEKLRLLMEIDLVENAGAGAYQLTDIGRGVAKTIG